MQTSTQNQTQANEQSLGDAFAKAVGTGARTTGKVLKDVGSATYHGGLMGLVFVAAYGTIIYGCKLINKHAGVGTPAGAGETPAAEQAPTA